MLEKFLATLERIADALEVIAAVQSGNDAPRVEVREAAKETATKATATKPKPVKETKAPEKAEAKKEDGDPLGGGQASPVTQEDMLTKLRELIAKDGKGAAFEVLKEKAKGAKNASEVKPEQFEDVYAECVERLG